MLFGENAEQCFIKIHHIDTNISGPEKQDRQTLTLTAREIKYGGPSILKVMENGNW